MNIMIGCEVYNLGTGKGTSVLEMVSAFEKASGKVFFTLLLLRLFPRNLVELRVFVVISNVLLVSMPSSDYGILGLI